MIKKHTAKFWEGPERPGDEGRYVTRTIEYNDRYPLNKMSREYAKRHGINVP